MKNKTVYSVDTSFVLMPVMYGKKARQRHTHYATNTTISVQEVPSNVGKCTLKQTIILYLTYLLLSVVSFTFRFNCHYKTSYELRSQIQRPYFLPDESETVSWEWIFMGWRDQGAFLHVSTRLLLLNCVIVKLPLLSFL